MQYDNLVSWNATEFYPCPHPAQKYATVLLQKKNRNILLSFELQTTQTFELYAAFSPLTSKSSAIEAINRLLKWLRKEENSIFILNGPTF